MAAPESPIESRCLDTDRGRPIVVTRANAVLLGECSQRCLASKPCPVCAARKKGEPVISGYATVWDSESRDLGGFVETVSPGSFAEVLTRSASGAGDNIAALYNHDKNVVLGRHRPGTLKLVEDAVGLRYLSPPPKHNWWVAELIERGDVTGSSYSFANARKHEQWSPRSAAGLPRRNLVGFTRVIDVGPVLFPAFSGTEGHVAARAIDMARSLQTRTTVAVPKAIEFIQWAHDRGLSKRMKTSDCGQVEKGRFGPGNTCAAGSGGGKDGDVPEGRVRSSKYGMKYAPENEEVVKKARTLSDEQWNTLPVETVKHGTELQANEDLLKTKPIDKVVSGKEPFREGYVTKLFRDGEGKLHVVDGHHRVAMHHALGKDLPVRIIDAATVEKLGGGSEPCCSKEQIENFAKEHDHGSKWNEAIKAHVPVDPKPINALHIRNAAAIAKRIGVSDSIGAAVIKDTNSATTLRELLADAKAAAPEFGRMVREAAKSAGGVANFGPGDVHMLKAPGKVSEKVRRKQTDFYEKLTRKGESNPKTRTRTQQIGLLDDVVRGSIITDTPEQLGDAIRKFKADIEASGGKIEIDNKWDNNDNPSGYVGVHAKVLARTPSGRGILSEVQFHVRSIYDGSTGSPKDTSHAVYEKARSKGMPPEASAAANHAMQLIFATAAHQIAQGS